VHGYRLRPDHVEAQLTAPQGADGVTLQLLGLQPGQGVEAVTIDGVPSTYLAYPDRVVLAGWSNGTHTVDVRLGPGHASASHEPILGMDGGLTRDASAPSGVSDHAPRLAAAVVAKDESASPTGPSAPRGAAESTSR